jgi:hypothetical protein
MAIADFNGDSKLDLAIADGAGVVLLLGNGDGTFQSPVTVATGGTFTAVVAADFNHDGKMDLAALVRSVNGGHGVVQVLLGNGDGTFGAAKQYRSGGLYCQSLAVVNFPNGLGLAVANFDSSTVSVLRGSPDGSFGRPVNYATGTNPEYVLSVDINGDGHPDLVTANFNSTNISVFLGNADGTFQPAANYPVQDLPYWVAVADLNGDGKLDLAVINASASSKSVSVLLGNGDGTFQGTTSFKTGGGLPTSVAAGLFDANGKPDLAIANQGSFYVSVLLNTTP